MRPTIPTLLLSSLVLLACDREESSDIEAIAESAEAELEAEDGAPAPRMHGPAHHGDRKLDRLCEKLECSATQREEIAPLLERLRHRPPRRGEGSTPADEALAVAFAGEELSADDLSAYRSARPSPAGTDDQVAAIVELHGLLDSNQRSILAEKIERRGLPWLGRAGKHRRHGPRAEGKGRPGRHGAKKVDHLCRRLDCTEDQRARLLELAAKRPAPPEVSPDDRTALARAFAGEQLSPDAVRAYRDAVAKAEEQAQAAADPLILAMHEVLTPSQRALLAERIRSHGLRALKLGGRGHGKHGKHGKRGKHRKHRGTHGKHPRPERPADGGQAFG